MYFKINTIIKDTVSILTENVRKKNIYKFNTLIEGNLVII